MEKHLHVICLNVPYPVDYGGVFDLFYKLPALQQQGVKIYLHCFEYGRGQQIVLTKYCESVYYYPRTSGFNAFSLYYPFIVKSRSSTKLLQRLCEDNYPILMEGMHCTYLLNDARFKQRKCFVRLHNIEHIYYRNLARFTNRPFKKLYFLWESFLLKRYEKSISLKARFLSVTPKDAEEYRKMGYAHVDFLPLFLPEWQVNSGEGKGTFCLYQGDLSVAENEKAATWLLQEVFDDLNIPFVIAGKNPSKKLQKLAESKSCTCLIVNPDENEMQDLIAKAHLNLIPSYNVTGIKLKLLNALYNGRYCVVNKETVEGTGLAECCHVASNANSFKTAISAYYNKSFCEPDITLRHQVLYKMYDNRANAEMLVKFIWEE